ncbi:MAG: signal peptide peptidase SppA [Mariprofundaceae bacterium]|nr:signal peptide peptidase SppA [Mariprofundaceae bacterium]
MFARILRFFDTLRRTLSVFIFLLLIGLISAAIMTNRPSVPDHALLVLNPQGEILEETNPSAAIFPPDFSAIRQTRLRDLIRVVRAAKHDARIHSMLLDVQDMDHASLVALQALGSEIDAFRKSGKQVYAYADHYSQGQYLLAAHADKIWLHSMGMLLIKGFSSYRNYFREALENMHVKIHLFRAGAYKSAAEPLVRSNMSAQARQETQAVLNQLWQAYKNDISGLRGIKPDALQNMLDKLPTAIRRYDGDPAAMALGEHLVDHLGSRSELFEQMTRASAGTENTGADIEETQKIEFKAYLRALGAEPAKKANQIGVLTASGTISDGLIDGGINGDDFAELIEKTAKNTHIKAVVLRIDSPGGSVQASEKIRAALVRLRKSGKPLIVSMAGMAASGGYWIAAEADEIWAAPTTLTGSIGVFGVFPNVTEGLASLGIRSDGVGTTKISSGLRPDRPLPKALAQTLQAGVDHVYGQFLDIVAKGRHLTHAQAAKIAEGRVWTGTDALRLGLADHLGGLDAAVAAAARRSGLKNNYSVTYIRAKRSLREQLLENILGEAHAWLPRMTMQAKIQTEDPAAFAIKRMLPQLWRENAYLAELLRPSGGIHAYTDLMIR